MKRDPDFFGDRELVLVYVARRLKEALALEAVLTEAALDYAVEPDRYTGGVVFRTERVGAFFYVAPESEASARAVMRDKGYKPHEERT
jgi:hypothetical protein